ncbi:MAG: hypothetical protein EYC69_09665 [Bacteroidetes bacterium]|nr:MAG: hypothetical protein EYC69_09665 [Bacteroidota bacterium]
MHLFLRHFICILCFFLFACSSQEHEKNRHDTVQANKLLLGYIYKMFETGDIDQIHKFVHVDMMEHTPDPLIVQTGIEGLKELIRVNHIAFPDLKIKVYNISGEGDFIYAHFNWAATNTGPIRSAEPTMRSVNIDGVDIIKVKDGKIVEHWGYWDALKFLNQMGQAPE